MLFLNILNQHVLFCFVFCHKWWQSGKTRDMLVGGEVDMGAYKVRKKIALTLSQKVLQVSAEGNLWGNYVSVPWENQLNYP